MVNFNVCKKRQKKRKKELDNDKSIKYKIKPIDSFKFMSSKLSYLVNNLSEIYSKECRRCKERKEISACDFIGLKNNKLHYKCNKCKRRPINGLIKKFLSKYKFCNNDSK